jgi:hypothetical protein
VFEHIRGQSFERCRLLRGIKYFMTFTTSDL